MGADLVFSSGDRPRRAACRAALHAAAAAWAKVSTAAISCSSHASAKLKSGNLSDFPCDNVNPNPNKNPELRGTTWVSDAVGQENGIMLMVR